MSTIRYGVPGTPHAVNWVDPLGLLLLGVFGGASTCTHGDFSSSMAVVVHHNGNVVLTSDLGLTVGPKLTWDIDVGIICSPFGELSDFVGDSRRVNIWIYGFGVVIAIPMNTWWKFSVSVDVWPGIDSGLSLGVGRTLKETTLLE